MRKLIVFFIVILFFVSVTPIFAQPQDEKGASQEAYEHASEDSIFNRVGDWFSTIGKSSEEREEILRERRVEREARREGREQAEECIRQREMRGPQRQKEN